MTTTNGDGDVTANTYDGDQLASTTVGYGTSAAATTSYTYDENGNIASITDPDGNVTSYTYDANGNVLTTTNALGTTTNTYDADGNLISTVDADGRKITYAYDGGQLMQEVWFNADGSVADTQTYTYDEDGNMLTASNSAGTYTYTYDDNQLSTQTDPNGLTLSYGYDEDGNLTTVSDSQGGVTSYVYDGNQVVSKTYQDATTQLRVNFTYDHDDNVLTETRYSDLAGTQLQGTTQYGYDGNQLTSIVQTDGSGTTLASYSYSYDAAGQMLSETDNGTTTNYAYNSVGELTQAGAQSYQYDANGNPIQTGTVIGPNNELLSDGTWNYQYDAAGNQIGKVNIATGETWTYVYNNANQLVSAVDVSASGTVLQQESNTYDVFGQRIGETETTGGSTMTQEFSYDTNGTLYADLNSSGNITTRYISSVTGPDEWLARVSSSDSAWLLSDHLGSVRTVVALTGGTVLDQITFDPFGTIVGQTNAANMGRLGFQGGQLDPITVTYNFGPRNYNPGTGTWTTQDPTGLSAGTNPYEFDDNSPTDMTDPSGEEPQNPQVPSVLVWNWNRQQWGFAPPQTASAVTGAPTAYDNTTPFRWGPATDKGLNGAQEKYYWDKELGVWYETPKLLEKLVPGIAQFGARPSYTPSMAAAANQFSDDEIIDLRIQQILNGTHPAISKDKLPQILAGVLPGAVGEAKAFLLNLPQLPGEIKATVLDLAEQIRTLAAQVEKGNLPAVTEAFKQWATASVVERKHRLAMVLNITDPTKFGEWWGAQGFNAGLPIAAGAVVKRVWEYAPSAEARKSVPANPISPSTGKPISLVTPQTMPAAVRADVESALANIKAGTKPSGVGKWGAPHGNYEGNLPKVDAAGKPITYKEYYLPKDAGDTTKWGSNRLVVGSDGNVYQTTTHYGQNGNPPFVWLGNVP